MNPSIASKLLKVKIYPLMCLFLFAVGCSSPAKKDDTPKLARDLNFDNQSSSSSETILAIPPELTRPNTTELFNNDRQVINRASRVLSTGNQGDILVRQSDEMQLKKLGANRWLEVKKPAGEVYQTAKRFLTGLGFSLTIDDSAIGILETNWKENKPQIPSESLGIVRSALSRALGQIYSVGRIDRFRMRIEIVDENTTEVFIAHQSMVEESVAGQNTWVFAPSDPELETELTYRYLVYLGLDLNQAQGMVQVSASEEETSNFIETPEGLGFELNESFARSWLLVGWAIDRSDYIIYDRNRQNGVFYIRLGDNLVDTRKGFWDKLVFWRKEVDISALRVQVKLNSLGENLTQVVILDENGGKISNDEAQIFLTDISKNI